MHTPRPCASAIFWPGADEKQDATTAKSEALDSERAGCSRSRPRFRDLGFSQFGSYAPDFFSIFVQESFSGRVRLKTRLPEVESGSRQK